MIPRTLRKLRFLDYLIIISVILGAVILFRFFNPEEKWIDAKIFSNNVTIFQAQSLATGDIEKDSSGKKIAEITDVQIYDTSNPEAVAANKDIFLTVRLLVDINPRSGELEYKNKIIKVGSPIELRFDKGLVTGRIGQLQGEEQKIETKLVTFKLYDQWPWFAESIKEGSSEKDRDGKNNVEVISKKVESAEVTTTTQSGQTILTKDPRKVDITIKAKIKIQKIGDELIFRQDEKIAIGGVISFTVGNTKILDANIVEIE